MVAFEALTWDARDSEDGDHVITIFGKTNDGVSVSVTSIFEPYFFIKIEASVDVRVMFQDITKKCGPCSPYTYGVVEKKDLWGFQNNETCLFVKLDFKNVATMRKCNARIREKYKVYEANVEPMLRFMHRTGIQSTGWLETGTNCRRAHLTRCTIDLFCNDWTTLKPIENDTLAPFIVGSFDIETNSSTGKFPNADIPDDACFQIAVTLKRLGDSEVYDKTCLCYKQTAPVDGCTIISFDTERELLLGFRDYILKHDVDILTGWNIFGFDLEFLVKRSIHTECSEEFLDLSKLRDYACSMVCKKLSSNALGDNELKTLPIPGRYVFDLFQDVKREHKLDSYSLNAVSAKFLNDQKIDMSPKEMFRRYAKGDPHELAEVAEYCVKDTLLPHGLMDKLCSLLNLLEMAKATWVPIQYLTERGQQIKVFSQMTRKARELGYMVPTFQYGSLPSEGYEGATVLDAQTGAYYTPITALDFEGLYPSIMIAHNLCYSTLVLDPKYMNIPGITYETFGSYTFAQDVPSLLPDVLRELKQFRKKAKKDMAAATGSMKSVYNGKQLAYKISMNSVYGFTGASKGMLPCVAIASTVTMKGRNMIETTKTYVEEHFPGSKVRYGDTDSVMVEFDVGGRTGIEAIEYSWMLGERAAKECTSLFKAPNNLELEKVYCPYFLYSKKRYAAKLWTKHKDGAMRMDYIDVKGLQLVRRDNTPYVREVCKELLEVIMESKNPEGATKLARLRAKELLDGRVPIDKLILSQKLGDSYSKSKKNPDGSMNHDDVNLPHMWVVRKMHEREPGSEPQSGDRVPFVLIETGIKNAKQFEMAEDPKWVVQNSIPLNYSYYFTNKFMVPVADLLEPLVPRDVLFEEHTKKQVKSKNIADMFTNFAAKQKERKNTK
jgi:DNA polymerase delta subunit 1